MTITDFLMARLYEDEAEALEANWKFGLVSAPKEVAPHIARHDPARVLREVEAKRKIVRDVACGFYDSDYDEAVEHLAAVYSDHPDYDPDWAVAG